MSTLPSTPLSAAAVQAASSARTSSVFLPVHISVVELLFVPLGQASKECCDALPYAAEPTCRSKSGGGGGGDEEEEDEE